MSRSLNATVPLEVVADGLEMGDGARIKTTATPHHPRATEYYGSHFASRRLRSEHRRRPSGTRPFVNAGAADMFQAVAADRRCRSAATLAGSRGRRDRGRACQLPVPWWSRAVATTTQPVPEALQLQR